jgi:putative endonuclease
METHFVYILYSPSTGSYYIGQTMDLENRLIQHNSHFFKDSHTKVADDWILKLSIPCTSRRMALAIEKHIKGNRSRKYLENLIRYSGISERLISKYMDL